MNKKKNMQLMTIEEIQNFEKETMSYLQESI
jgi:hypothetical protein